MISETVFVLAGGLGTRLGRLVKNTPKAMIPIRGRPFIHYKLEELQSQGAKKAVLCVGHMSDQIIQFVGDGSAWGLSVNYSQDTRSLLGTGGALANALETFPQENFYVVYGDSVLDFDYPELKLLEGNPSASMAICKSAAVSGFGNVVWDKISGTARYQVAPKTNLDYMDYGVSFLESGDFLDFALGRDTFGLGDYFEHIGCLGKLLGVEAEKPFHEIGSLDGITKYEFFLGGQK